MKNVPSLSSRWLAVTCAGLYLVVSAVVGVALLAAPRPDADQLDRDAPADVAERTEDGTGVTTTLTTHPPPAGFQHVQGPERMRTVIPVGWRVARGGAPGALRAADPSDSARFVGFGAAPAPSTDIGQTHAETESRFAERTTAYRRIELNRATYAGNPAVEWEYRHDDGTGTQHVRGLFWRVDGMEYFVFASAPESAWPRMRPVYDEMVAHSTP
ncbi:hypothetical protein [Actinophytocola xanthii]|uniref:hypothetical protein n=1 Tax=Actinophytocola xanthii TaxID=1912961 RepID=UPI0011788556|nr:hypothetical protein [Actinophytocola xanthii]